MSNSNVYSVSEQEMNELAYGLGKTLTNTEDTASSMSSDFAGFKKTGLLSGAVDTIQKNINQVSQMGMTVRKKIMNQTASTFEIETMLANKMDGIEVPQDFVKNDTRKYNSIDDIVLNKKDDKAINANNAQSAFNEIADNSIKEEQRLKDITGEQAHAFNEIADNSIKKEHELKDITGEDSREFNEIADNSIKEEQALGNITGVTSEEFKEIDDNSIKDEEKLSNISENETNKVELDESKYLDDTEAKLKNISQAGGQGEIKFDMPSQSFSQSNISSQTNTSNVSYSSTSSDEEKERTKEQMEIMNNLANNYTMYENMKNQEAKKEEENK